MGDKDRVDLIQNRDMPDNGRNGSSDGCSMASELPSPPSATLPAGGRWTSRAMLLVPRVHWNADHAPVIASTLGIPPEQFLIVVVQVVVEYL